MKIFIGSSSEARAEMDQLAFWVEEKKHRPIRWDDPGVFPPGAYLFPRLREISTEVDAAIFIFSEDDLSWFRQDLTAIPRDNILLEYGLFVGALGPEATIICRKGQPRQPIDLQGIVFINLDQKSEARIRLREWLASLSTGTHPIPAPKRENAGILIDKSHAQGQWHRGSIFDLADPGHSARAALSAMTAGPLEIVALEDSAQFADATLSKWSGLILGLPYHKKIAPETRARIVAWVRNGGRLALLGFELGERHHGGNLNELADEFGLRFNSDIVGPPGSIGKPYGVTVHFGDFPAPGHPLLAGVPSLQLANCCTLASEPGITPLVQVGMNQVLVPNRESLRFDRGELQTPGGTFDQLGGTAWWPVVAQAHPDLCGKGEVVAIGTWELLTRNAASPQPVGNLQFLHNLLHWLHR